MACPRYALGVLALTVLLQVGCEGPRRGPSSGTADAPMTATGELANPNPTPMDARAEFFGGSLTAEVLLGKSDAQWLNSKSAEAGRGGQAGGGRFSAGMGGGGRHGGGRGMGGGGEAAGRGGGREGRGPSEANEAPRGPAIRASNAAPVQLRLRLENHGDAPLDVEVLDFNSDLGNFVVLPKHLLVPPDGTVQAEPMTSRLGVPAVESIPLKVRLRVGGAKGRVEEQVLTLRPRPDAPADTSAPVPAAGS